jgi:hypothetical protein
VNLDATETVPAAAFTLDGNGDGVSNDPSNFNKSTTITVYDSQGGAHDVTAYFVKTRQCLGRPLRESTLLILHCWLMPGRRRLPWHRWLTD